MREGNQAGYSTISVRRSKCDKRGKREDLLKNVFMECCVAKSRIDIECVCPFLHVYVEENDVKLCLAEE